MGKLCNLTINGVTKQVLVGSNLVDAGIQSGALVPFDCCTGQCETCRVKVLSDNINPQGTVHGDTVLACQATIEGDAIIEFDTVPQKVKRNAVVKEINLLADKIYEVVLTLDSPLDYYMGQYVSLKFAGFPARDYSPTIRMDGSYNPYELVFHIKQMERGVVSQNLNKVINPGYKVKIEGPYGSSFLRKDDTNHLVLVASGTGWAPIWALAYDAILNHPHREITIITGTKEAKQFYMEDGLDWLKGKGVVDIIKTVSVSDNPEFMTGKPCQHLPHLTNKHTVYVAGSPNLVNRVMDLTQETNTICYADPFYASQKKTPFFDRIANTFKRPFAQTAVEQTA